MATAPDQVKAGWYLETDDGRELLPVGPWMTPQEAKRFAAEIGAGRAVFMPQLLVAVDPKSEPEPQEMTLRNMRRPDR